MEPVILAGRVVERDLQHVCFRRDAVAVQRLVASGKSITVDEFNALTKDEVHATITRTLTWSASCQVVGNPCFVTHGFRQIPVRWETGGTLAAKEASY